jgi:hypothetical protein
MHWWELQRLAVADQDARVDFLNARRGMLTASDFASVVPRTEKFVGHIFDQWKYDEKVVSLAKTEAGKCGKQSYAKFIEAKLLVRKDDTPAGPQDNKALGSPRNEMERGNLFEDAIVVLTEQIYGVSIARCGFIASRRTPNSGVSPDGLFMETPVDPSSGLLVESKFRLFEAKTVVSRAMDKKVPLKFHIQMERALFEAGVQTCVYTEVRFEDLSEEEWTASFTDEGAYAKYGLMVISEGKVHYAHAMVRTMADFLAYRDAWSTGDAPYVKYFRVDELWTTEVHLWHDYEKVYGALIHEQSEYLAYLQTAGAGKDECLSMFNIQDGGIVGGEAAAKRKRKVKEYLLRDYTTLKRYKPESENINV